MNIMAKIQLSNDFLLEARQHADVFSRTVSKQIEYWSRIGKIVEENPDLPYNFIKNILLSQEEVSANQVIPYKVD